MEALKTMGVLVATPLVVQFFLQTILTDAQRAALDNRIKILVSVAMGAVLAVLLSLYTEAWFALVGIQYLWVVLNGFIDGALAAGAMGLILKTAERISTVRQ